LRHGSKQGFRKSGRGDEDHGTADVKTAMQYQHPELEIVRALLTKDREQGGGIEFRHTLRHTQNINFGK